MMCNHVNSGDAGAHHIHPVTHSGTADCQAHWGFEVLLLPVKEPAPPAFSAACISRKDAARAEAIGISSLLSSDYCSRLQKRSC